MKEMIVSLERLNSESVSEYDNRINKMRPLCVGKAFFRSINYDASKHLFSVFVIWNDVNNKLLDPMPAGGFQIYCSEKDAMTLCKSFYGYDTYARLISVDGDVFFKDIYVSACNKKMVVSFTGCKTIEPDFIPEPPAVSSVLSLDDNKRIIGQYKGENTLGSFNPCSYNLGSFSLGSFRKHILMIGSFNVSSFNMTSFSAGSFNIGSFNRGVHGVGSFSTGSYNIFGLGNTSFNYGSFNLGSYNFSTFASSFNTSSFSVSSFNAGSFNSWNQAGSFAGLWGSATGINYSDIPYFDLLKEIFGIGMLGYGLDNL